ncbi:unnamed protein product [Ixodes hexagonus]
MKSRFSTVDIVAMVCELRQRLVGMRVVQVYDVDSKTYLFKLNRHDEKAVLLVESGVRLHTTDFAWPKNLSPSGFSMKLRKHLRNKRLEAVSQLGADRIVDLQFGVNEAAYHVLLELYDRGNLVLTDGDYLILNILRPRTGKGDDDDVKFVVREKYPVQSALNRSTALDAESLGDILRGAKPADTLRKLLTPKVAYGPALLEHVLRARGLSSGAKVADVDPSQDIATLLDCLRDAEALMERARAEPCKGYILTRVEKRVTPAEDGSTEISSYQEFHPFLWRQHEREHVVELASFSAAVDQFFSSLEMQRISLKAHQKEKEALKKLENIRTDHEKRIVALEQVQREDAHKAELIEINLELVERALLVLRSALANQIGWAEITELLREAQEQGDPVARAIKQLKLDTNHFAMLLRDPYEEGAKDTLVDIDLDLSAYANARRYYDQKRHAAGKQQKTLESSTKAYKSAEKKTKEALKQVALTSNIARARKAFWFEKFFWFISSEDYLVIGGRDAQQNEMIVKRHLNPGDVYVHADLHGASSIVIKNPGGGPVPPKTLNEAGTMAICYSAAWDAKVVTSAWWVYHHQVSKTAPTGQYLTPGAFMIRGKKNYLPPSYLIMGFGFLYKLDEDSIERHSGERRVRTAEEDASATPEKQEEELELSEASGSDGEGDEAPGEAFPDTVVKLPHELPPAEEVEEVVYSQQSKSAARGPHWPRKAAPVVPAEKPPDPQPAPETKQRAKRGTHGKMKKMKEKYKDQDEEERRLRMEILASAGTPKEPKGRKQKKGAKKIAGARERPQPGHPGTGKPHLGQPYLKQSQPVQLEEAEASKAASQTAQSEKPQSEQTQPEEPQATKPQSERAQSEKSQTDERLPEQPLSEPNTSKERAEKNQGAHEEEEDAEEEEEETAPGDETRQLLASLTGCPVAEDGLLFAVPVCAPYGAMQNFKHKVKVTPGTGRRGKAAKTALTVFMHDRATSTRERDLLRASKDQDISRNIPGKVKLSAPHLQKHK